MMNMEYQNLTKQEAFDLAVRAQGGDKKAASELCSKMTKMVYRQASRPSRNYGVNFEDVFQNGMLGICKAIAEFDANKNDNFIPYAKLWIRAYVNMCVAENVSLLKVGRFFHVFSAVPKHVKIAKQEHPEWSEEQCTDFALRKVLGTRYTEENVKQYRLYLNTGRFVHMTEMYQSEDASSGKQKTSEGDEAPVREKFVVNQYEPPEDDYDTNAETVKLISIVEDWRKTANPIEVYVLMTLSGIEPLVAQNLCWGDSVEMPSQISRIAGRVRDATFSKNRNEEAYLSCTVRRRMFVKRYMDNKDVRDLYVAANEEILRLAKKHKAIHVSLFETMIAEQADIDAENLIPVESRDKGRCNKQRFRGIHMLMLLYAMQQTDLPLKTEKYPPKPIPKKTK